jgi:hypothetical protein
VRAQRDLALCTGHTSADDALVVAELARMRGRGAPRTLLGVDAA